MCIYIYTYIYIYIYICISLSIYIHIYIYICFNSDFWGWGLSARPPIRLRLQHRGKLALTVRSVFKISCLFLRPRPWQFEI